MGDALVSEGELMSRKILEELASFSRNKRNRRGRPTLDFKSGSLTDDNIITSLPKGDGERIDFVPIGLNKPLTIEIRHIYTGEYPKPTFFGKTKDMLVTTALKSISTYEAAPRAVNLIMKNVASFSNIRTPPATEKGTPLVYYSPAQTVPATILTLEIGFDEFPEEIFGMLSTALMKAAGIPIFVSQSIYLTAAGAIAKLVGEIGKRLFDSNPLFKATVPLNFLRPGEISPIADFRLIVEDSIQESALQDLKVNEDGILVDKKEKQFDGDFPYAVISLDGRENKTYEDFTATAAGAVLLEKFYNIKEGQEQPLEPLFEAVKLYNDLQFRKKAEGIAKQLESLNKESEEYKMKSEAYKAAVANILNDYLKPKLS
jgi:hypothetical protein